jgi:geranylgeranyl diphosphate synthase, type II
MFDRLEAALDSALARLAGGECPPRLAEAIRYAVAPPAHRLRPRLLYAVAAALGEDDPALTDAAAVAVELLHCASLIQDDMPAFDGALERRGRSALHLAFGDATAILASDALILGAFETVASATTYAPERTRQLTILLARATGAPGGAVAGQAWEEEPSLSMDRYHQAKTASLFEAATMAGAVAAGCEPEPWRAVGRHLGMAYQLADDLADTDAGVAGSDAVTGKPNAALRIGVKGTRALFDRHARQAIRSIPLCPHRRELTQLVRRLLAAFHASQEKVPAGRAGHARPAAKEMSLS